MIAVKKKNKPYDKNTQDSRELAEKIVHGSFLKKGTIIAFPTCFPGVTIPIPADESRITALDVTDDGIVYGGTSGSLTHLFVAMFHGVTGVVFDMGTVAGADHCVAICCGDSGFAACVNGSGGGRIITRQFQHLPIPDLLQEWFFRREPFRDMGEVVSGEKIVHAVVTDLKQNVIGVTENHLFVMDMATGKVEVVADAPGLGHLGVGFNGDIFGLDEGDYLWRYDLVSGKLKRGAVLLPQGIWHKRPIRWARDNWNRMLYTADAGGNLFAFSERDGFSSPLGRTMLLPVGPMAVTHDGRLFGWCGDGMARLFCYDRAGGKVKDLGVAASVIERRRYGYTFGSAVVGRDGEIYFGEDDDLGHLWIYFPGSVCNRG